MNYINYFFGEPDKEDLFELEITQEMLHDSAYEMLVQLSQSELIDFILDNIPDDVLFDVLFYDLKDEYEPMAHEIWRENRR